MESFGELQPNCPRCGGSDVDEVVDETTLVTTVMCRGFFNNRDCGHQWLERPNVLDALADI